MLGSFVKVRVTNPIGTVNADYGFEYNVNFGYIMETPGEAFESAGHEKRAYVMGIRHAIREFEGRVVARIERPDGQLLWIVAPKSRRYINNDIREVFDPFEKRFYGSDFECFYEKSCGAVIFSLEDGIAEFLLIKNKRSVYWGFPKGHIEPGETEKETALREVLEETGLSVKILPEFSAKSEYVMQGKVEKTVTIFLAQTDQKQPVLQQDEIDDFFWGNYENAMRQLKFENDKTILNRAYKFLLRKKYIIG